MYEVKIQSIKYKIDKQQELYTGAQSHYLVITGKRNIICKHPEALHCLHGTDIANQLYFKIGKREKQMLRRVQEPQGGLGFMAWKTPRSQD